MSLTISPAIISPATDGTNDILPGTWFLAEHFLFVPGGQMQLVLQLDSDSLSGFIGSSVEYITFKLSIFLFLSSFLITFANGHVLVLYISVIVYFDGSSLFPVPIAEIIGIPNSLQFLTNSIFAVTVSIQSAT